MNASEVPNSDFPEKRRTVTDVEIDQIVDSLEGLRYGAVQIIVQDGHELMPWSSPFRLEKL